MSSVLYHLLDALGKPKADDYRALAHKAARAADLAFNGSFYPRGFLPDGSPLGGESRIDSLPQSWAVLSGCAPKGRAERAVRAALRRLDEMGARQAFLSLTHEADMAAAVCVIE